MKKIMITVPTAPVERSIVMDLEPLLDNSPDHHTNSIMFCMRLKTELTKKTTLKS